MKIHLKQKNIDKIVNDLSDLRNAIGESNYSGFRKQTLLDYQLYKKSKEINPTEYFVYTHMKMKKEVRYAI